MAQQYTAAVIGAGMGGRLSIQALAASNRFTLSGVADLSPHARQAVAAQYPDLPTYANHQALFAAGPLDVVCVSTWPPSHRAVTQDALAQPLQGLLVEKPLADNTAAGRALLTAIQAKNLPLVTPHGLLVANHVRQIIDRVQSGEIGALQLIEIQCTGWDIINAGIHWLNFCVTLTDDEPVDFILAGADTSSRTYRDGMQVETLAVTYIQLRSGLRIVMNTGDYVKISEAEKGVLFRLVGSRGRLDFYAWEPRYRLLNAAYPHGRLIEVDPGSGSAHQRYLEQLALQIDRGEPDYIPPERSLTALEWCEAAYLSARHHCAVTLPLSDFSPPTPSDWQPGRPYQGQGGGRDGRRLPPQPAHP